MKNKIFENLKIWCHSAVEHAPKSNSAKSCAILTKIECGVDFFVKIAKNKQNHILNISEK